MGWDQDEGFHRAFDNRDSARCMDVSAVILHAAPQTACRLPALCCTRIFFWLT